MTAASSNLKQTILRCGFFNTRTLRIDAWDMEACIRELPVGSRVRYGELVEAITGGDREKVIEPDQARQLEAFTVAAGLVDQKTRIPIFNEEDVPELVAQHGPVLTHLANAIWELTLGPGAEALEQAKNASAETPSSDS